MLETHKFKKGQSFNKCAVRVLNTACGKPKNEHKSTLNEEDKKEEKENNE